MIIVGSSEYLCSALDKFCNHLIEFLVWVGKRICRFVLILSQMIKMNAITLTNEIVDLIKDTVFHVVYASGQSEYHRGIPASHRKYCGKNICLPLQTLL
jgi:hypothetical protein